MSLNKLLLIIFIGISISCVITENKPEDFDKFWDETVLELGTNISSEIIKDSIADDKRWTLNRIESFQGVYIYAWTTDPIKPGKFPVKIKFSGLGKGQTNMNIVPHKWFLRQKNSINMVVDIRGQGLSTEKIKFNGFLTNGLDDKYNYIYRGAFMDAVKSVDFIAQNPKSDGNIIVTGGSQGGTLSIVATALNPKVTMCIAGFPFLTDMANYNKEKWPMKIFIQNAKRKEIDLDDLQHTLSYFDMINFVDKIKTPIFIRSQEKDTVTPPEGALNFFSLLRSNKKSIYIEPCEGHGCSSKSRTASELERIFIKTNLIESMKDKN